MRSSRKVLVPFGTRPEIVKLAPIVAALVAGGFEVRTLMTGQHQDPSLTDRFFADLGLVPDERWSFGGTPEQRMGAMTEAAERALSSSSTARPDLLLVLGDTNTVPMFSLAARRNGVPVAHVEAGLRSRNDRSVEEVNRKVAAACASLHFAPTAMAESFLLREGVPATRIWVVGNPVIDVLRSRGVQRTDAALRAGVVLTAHRPTNVDSRARLEMVVELARRLASTVGPVTFPVHPRTRARLDEHGLAQGLDVEGVRACDPLRYDEMLAAIAASKVVVTDSGGLQEEASYLGVPVVVLRTSTPRWEGVASGASVLVGLDVERALAAAVRLSSPAQLERVAGLACPYGDGRTAERIAAVLSQDETWELLALAEPDLTAWRAGDPPPGPR